MTYDLKDASSLLGSRICHDLISPLGAISNGLELLSMTQTTKSPELQLIEESIENANSRIKFFRVALGAASGTQVMARSEILKLIAGCYGDGRINIRWDPTADPTRTEAKVGLLALMCMESALPQGGEIRVHTDRGEWQINAFGPKIRYEPGLWAALDGGDGADVTSSDVQFALMRAALDSMQRTVKVGHSDTAISLKY